MKINYIFALLMALLLSSNLSAQELSVKQVITGTGGVYGDPSDHVMITSYDPETQNSVIVGEIIRESIQDIYIYLDWIFVAAEDSIVKYDANTLERLASVYESNLSRLHVYDGNVYVSRRSDLTGPPSDGVYLKVYNQVNLDFIGAVEGISSDVADMQIVMDTLFMAVSGDWQATEGKLAKVNIETLQLMEEINMGTDAVGISDLYIIGNNIVSVNRSPYGATTGSVSSYNYNTSTFNTTILNYVVGKGAGIDRVTDETLYLILDYGIGSYDLTTDEVIDPAIVPDPGSASFTYIAAVEYDFVNNQFYVTVTDYFSMGEGRIYNDQGEITGSFDAGISAEAIVINYDVSSDINFIEKDISVLVWPNPVEGYLHIKTESNDIENISIISSNGLEVLNRSNINSFEKINLESLKPGFYIVMLKVGDRIHKVKVVKF